MLKCLVYSSLYYSNFIMFHRIHLPLGCALHIYFVPRLYSRRLLSSLRSVGKGVRTALLSSLLLCPSILSIFYQNEHNHWNNNAVWRNNIHIIMYLNIISWTNWNSTPSNTQNEKINKITQLYIINSVEGNYYTFINNWRNNSQQLCIHNQYCNIAPYAHLIPFIRES